MAKRCDVVAGNRGACKGGTGIAGNSTILITLNTYSHVLPSIHEKAMDDLSKLFTYDKVEDYGRAMREMENEQNNLLAIPSTGECNLSDRSYDRAMSLKAEMIWMCVDTSLCRSLKGSI